MAITADVFFRLFISRVDVCGAYLGLGPSARAITGYHLKQADIAEHIAGTACMGAHAVSLGQTCKWIAWDVDAHGDDASPEENWEDVQRLCEELEGRGIKYLIEDSNGRGGFHVWAFFFPAVPARDAYGLARSMAEDADVSCECFPKQEATGEDSPGSWVRLPGQHPRHREHWSRFFVGGAWAGLEALAGAEVNERVIVPSIPSSLPEARKNEQEGLPILADVISALGAIPNEAETWGKVGASSWYDLWFRVLAALSLYDAPEAKAAAWEWSLKHPDGQDKRDFEKKWGELKDKPGRVTGRSIIAMAAQYFGWVPVNKLVFTSSEPRRGQAKTEEDLRALHTRRMNQMNRQFAVLESTSRVVIFKTDLDHQKKATHKIWREEDFRRSLSNRFIQVGVEPNPKTGFPERMALSKWWLTHRLRRQIKGAVFAPGDDLPQDFMNLWDGWGVKHSEPGECDLFLEHLLKVICSENIQYYDYLLAWMADAIQRPMERSGAAVVLRGVQGAGKGLAVNYFGRIFGQHYLTVTNPGHITGKFNGHLETCQLLFGDEAFNVRNKQAEGALKGLITEPYITIERKGVDAYQSKNLVRLMMASNSDWIVPAGIDDRRFFVLDVSPVWARDDGYFAALAKEMDNGGPAALFRHLCGVDVSSVNLRKPPRTSALTDQKTHSLDSVATFWLDRLYAGVLLDNDPDWMNWVESSKFYKAYVDFARNTGERHAESLQWFFRRVKVLCPQLQRRRKLEGAQMRWGYDTPALEFARSQFESYIGAPIEWDIAQGRDVSQHGRVEIIAG